MKQALYLKDEGRLQIRIDITLYLEKDPTAVPPPPPPTTPVTPVVIGPRQTATTRQEGVLPEAVQRQEDAGDYSQSIRIRWPCAVLNCLNHRGGKAGYCYWRSSNSKDSHYPITKDVVTAWSKDIKEGLKTVEEPSYAVMELLFKAQKRLENQSHTQKMKPPSNQPIQPLPGQPLHVYVGIPPASVPNQAVADHPPSSAPTETPPLEMMAELFKFAKESID